MKCSLFPFYSFKQPSYGKAVVQRRQAKAGQSQNVDEQYCKTPRCTRKCQLVRQLLMAPALNTSLQRCEGVPFLIGTWFSLFFWWFISFYYIILCTVYQFGDGTLVLSLKNKTKYYTNTQNRVMKYFILYSIIKILY